MSVTCRVCGRRNADGAQFCTDRECGAYLGWAGEHTMSLPDPRGAQQRVGLRIELSAAELAVAPGEAGMVALTLRNTGTLVEGVAVSVVGSAAGWCTVDPARVAVYPQRSAECTLRFAPPLGPGPGTAPAGRARFQVRCASLDHPGLVATAGGTVLVGEVHELSMQLAPAVSRGRGRTRHRVCLDNRGNVVERLRLTASDAEGALTMNPADTVIDLPPGRADLPLSVSAPRRWLGNPHAIPIQVTAAPLVGSTPAGQALRADGTRHVLPVLRTWTLTAALGALLLVGGGTAAVTLAGSQGASVPPGATSAGGAGSPLSVLPTGGQPSSAAVPSEPTPPSSGAATTPPTTGGTQQPLVPPVEPTIPGEDCIPYNPGDLHIADAGSIGWQLLEGASHAMLLLDNQSDAQRALALAQRHTAMCFFGRGSTRPDRFRYIVYYWRGSSGRLAAIPAEDCIPYDPAALRVVNAGAMGWQLFEGASHAMLLLDSETDAKNALTWAKAFTKECFIGRDNQRPDRPRYIVGYWLH